MTPKKSRPEPAEWVPPVCYLTVDLVVFTIRREKLQVLLIERGEDPFKGWYALPGGYVGEHEAPEAAALRELLEETSVDASSLHLEELRTYATPDRDPRGRIVTMAYLAIAPDLPEPKGSSDAARAVWVPVKRIRSLMPGFAFDHRQILDDGIERARAKLEYTPLASAFCQPEFTIAELRAVYEIIWGGEVDPGNFHRKVTKAEQFLIQTGELRPLEVGRPAALYRRGSATLLHPPMLRPTVR